MTLLIKLLQQRPLLAPGSKDDYSWKLIVGNYILGCCNTLTRLFVGSIALLHI
jgi:hypothetical protein